MLNIKKLFTKLTPKIKTMTGTTDSNGNLSLGLSDSAAKSIIGITGSNFVYIPFVYAGNWYAKTVSSNSASTPVVNENVNVSIKYLGGGYCLKALSAIFSRLAERRWEYAEHKEDSHETSADNRNKLHQILWNWYCVGVIFIKRNLGIHATVWDYILGNADSDLLKGRERINSVIYHYGSKDNDAILGKLQHYGKHQECRLGRNRQGVAISERGWCCA